MTVFNRLKAPLFTLLFLYAALLLLFRQTLAFNFFQDDFFFLSWIKTASPGDLLFGGIVVTPYFRPLPMIWLPWVNDWIWGPRPFGFYLQLYLALALLLQHLYLLLNRLLNQRLIAAFGTALFAFSFVLPYNLGWPLTGNIEILPALACAAGTYYFIRWLDTGALRHQAGVLVSVFIGIASKEYTFLLPAIFAVCYVVDRAKKGVASASLAEIRGLISSLAPSVSLIALWTAVNLVRFPHLWRSQKSTFVPSNFVRVLQIGLDSVLPFSILQLPAAAGPLLLILLAGVAWFWSRSSGRSQTVWIGLALATIPILPIALVPLALDYYSTPAILGVCILMSMLAQELWIAAGRLPLPAKVAPVAVSLILCLLLGAEYHRSLGGWDRWATVGRQPMTQRLLKGIETLVKAPENSHARTVALVGISEEQVWCIGLLRSFRYLYPQLTVVDPSVKGTRIQETGLTADLVLYVDGQGNVSRTASAQDPSRIAAHAGMLFDQGKYADSLSEYATLTAKDPGNALFWYRYAFCLHLTGKLRESIDPYTRALELNAPGLESWIRYNRGGAYLGQGRLDEAGRDLNRARALDPANAGVVVYLEELKKRRAAK